MARTKLRDMHPFYFTCYSFLGREHVFSVILLRKHVAGHQECLLNSTLCADIPWAIQMLKARKCSKTLQDAVNDWQPDHVILLALSTSGAGCGGADRTVR